MVSEISELFQVKDIRVKDREKALIYDLIFSGKARSRKEILAGHGIRPAVVTAAVKELVQDKLVLEEKLQAPRSGRPEINLRPNVDRIVSVGMYIESRDLKCALVNLKGDILRAVKAAIPADATAQEFLGRCRGSVREILGDAPAGSLLAGIGISLSGSIDGRNKRWLSSYRWPRIRNLDLRRLEAAFGCDVSVRKDLESLLAHYLQRDARLRAGTTVLFHWGFGVGFTYAHEGRPANDGDLRFGEIGHTRIDPADSRRCICGSRGCLETDAAIWALLPELRRISRSLPDNEQEVEQFCRAHPEVQDLPALRRALDAIAASQLTLYRLFYPSHVLLLGPFFAVPGILRRLVQKANREVAATGGKPPTFSVIPDGYQGCVFTTTRRLFAARLTGMLRARF